MDYSEVCQGWIYCIINKVNGKKYIGQTMNYNVRKTHHFGKCSTCQYLRHAMDKYGRENFEMKPILTFKAINKKVCLKVLTTLEVFYISKYDTFNPNKGYNLTVGGEGGLYHRTEENKRKISESLKGHHPSEETREKYRQNSHVENLGDCRKAVLLYNLDGSFYTKFSSIREAIASFGKTVNSAKSQVAKALKRPDCQALGYLWRYCTEEQIPSKVQSYTTPLKKPVYHYTLEGNLIKSYPSVWEASEELGIKASAITKNALCSGGRPHRKDYWSYESPTT